MRIYGRQEEPETAERRIYFRIYGKQEETEIAERQLVLLSTFSLTLGSHIESVFEDNDRFPRVDSIRCLNEMMR